MYILQGNVLLVLPLITSCLFFSFGLNRANSSWLILGLQSGGSLSASKSESPSISRGPLPADDWYDCDWMYPRGSLWPVVLLDAILVVSVVFDVIDGEGAPGAGMPEIPVTLFDDRWGLSRELL